MFNDNEGEILVRQFCGAINQLTHDVQGYVNHSFILIFRFFC